jgi:hypothetical protein
MPKRVPARRRELAFLRKSVCGIAKWLEATAKEEAFRRRTCRIAVASEVREPDTLEDALAARANCPKAGRSRSEQKLFRDT